MFILYSYFDHKLNTLMYIGYCYLVLLRTSTSLVFVYSFPAHLVFDLEGSLVPAP